MNNSREYNQNGHSSRGSDTVIVSVAMSIDRLWSVDNVVEIYQFLGQIVMESFGA